MTMPSRLAVRRVALTVHDLEGVSAFYQHVVGLQRLQVAPGVAAPGVVALGAGGAPLLELRQDTAARRSSAREAGLYHTAFLLPERADLGRWLRHATAMNVPLAGAADHLVSEALYLADPEGNGIEIYADRPHADWRWDNGQVAMANERLDLNALAKAGGAAAWQGAPAGSVVGHVHLQVGAVAAAEAFYAGVLGLGVTARYPGGTFYAAAGYHHHLATNIWNSRGAGPRDGTATGLANMEIALDPAALAAAAARAQVAPVAGRLVLHDPWGTAITLVAD